jgi:thioredoxin-related protein
MKKQFADSCVYRDVAPIRGEDLYTPVKPMMKRLGALAVVFLLLPASLFAEVHFKQLSMAEAMKLAKKEKKAIMVDFYTDWCSWCKVLDRQTYSDKKVGEFAEDHFISLKVDAEKGDGIALAKQYSVQGYPTVMFFAADGKVLNRVVGYQDTSAFTRSMEMAVAGGLQGLLDKTTAKKTMNDAQAWMTLGDYYSNQDKATEAISAYDHVLTLDPKDAKKFYEQALYAKAFVMPASEQMPKLEEAMKLYPDRPEARRAFTTLLMNDFNGQAPERAGQRMDDWANTHGMDADAFNMFAWEAAKKGIMLERAQDYATRAVMAYPDVNDRANALDTKAVVVAKLGRPQDAAIFETQALSLLTAGDKRTKEFTDRKAEFEKQTQAAGGTVVMPR